MCTRVQVLRDVTQGHSGAGQESEPVTQQHNIAFCYHLILLTTRCENFKCHIIEGRFA
jgi:hypothetical protein